MKPGRMKLPVLHTHRMLAACLLLLGAMSSHAQTAATPQTACRADYSKFCANTKPGGGRAAQCLKQHQTELSSACRSSMAALAPCKEQVAKICGAQSDPAQRKKCMREHKSELADVCRARTPA